MECEFAQVKGIRIVYSNNSIEKHFTGTKVISEDGIDKKEDADGRLILGVCFCAIFD